MCEIFCENNFCIYWNNQKCMCSSIHLNGCGLCDECIRIKLDDNIICEKRKKILENFGFFNLDDE